MGHRGESGFPDQPKPSNSLAPAPPPTPAPTFSQPSTPPPTLAPIRIGLTNHPNVQITGQKKGTKYQWIDDPTGSPSQSDW